MLNLKMKPVYHNLSIHCAFSDVRGCKSCVYMRKYGEIERGEEEWYITWKIEKNQHEVFQRSKPSFSILESCTDCNWI